MANKGSQTIFIRESGVWHGIANKRSQEDFDTTEGSPLLMKSQSRAQNFKLSLVPFHPLLFKLASQITFIIFDLA